MSLLWHSAAKNNNNHIFIITFHLSLINLKTLCRLWSFLVSPDKLFDDGLVWYRAGPKLRQVIDQLDNGEFEGQKLQGTFPDFEVVRDKLVDSLMSCLEGRFASIDEGVLGATRLADLTTWPPAFDETNHGTINNNSDEINKTYFCNNTSEISWSYFSYQWLFGTLKMLCKTFSNSKFIQWWYIRFGPSN